MIYLIGLIARYVILATVIYLKIEHFKYFEINIGLFNSLLRLELIKIIRPYIDFQLQIRRKDSQKINTKNVIILLVCVVIERHPIRGNTTSSKRRRKRFHINASPLRQNRLCTGTLSNINVHSSCRIDALERS